MTIGFGLPVNLLTFGTEVPIERLFAIKVNSDVLRILHPIGSTVSDMANESKSAIERNRMGILLGNDNKSYGYIVRDLTTQVIHYPRFITPIESDIQVNEISTDNISPTLVYTSPFDFHALMRLPDSPEKQAWIEAARQEIVGLRDKHHAWRVVTIEEAKKEMGEDFKLHTYRDIFSVKRNDKNKIVRHKARLVIHGHKRRDGIEYNESETYSAVARRESIFLLVTISTIWKSHLQFEYDLSMMVHWYTMILYPSY